MWRLVCAVLWLCGWARSQPPSPSAKTWWAKQLVPGLADLYTAGRLTERQLKHAAESDFRSVISLFYHAEPSWVGEEPLPSTDRARHVTKQAGMDFAHILGPGENWTRVETVERFTGVYSRVHKPVLFHCVSAKTATALALLYLANQTRHDAQFKPRVYSRDFYQHAALIGYDFTGARYKSLVADITGEPVIVNPPRPDTSIAAWNRYWLVKPVYKNWFIAGQIQSNYLPQIIHTGFQSILNIRKGNTSPPDGRPSQEEVALINIRDKTGTYNATGRQSTERLEATRIDPTKPNDYISADSDVNYESRNYLAFGDEVGYSEELERGALNDTGMAYSLTPLYNTYTRATWEIYRETWLANADRNVLVKCRVGFRASVVALVSAGTRYGLDSAWALRRAAQLGYYYERAGRRDIVDFIIDILDHSP